MNSRAPRLSLDRVSVGYDGALAVRDVSGHFEPGSLTAIVGPNGAGKSTLLKAVTGVIKPSSGRIGLGGLPLRQLGYLPQAAQVDQSFPLTVADVVAMGAWRQLGAFRGLLRRQSNRIFEALEMVGLDGFATRSISALSIGQFQRALFARLLLQDASVILLDEPFAAVDARTTRDLLALVGSWHAQGRTVIAVLHDMDQVRQHFPETLLLANRCVGWGATGDILTPENLEQASRHADPGTTPERARHRA
ncbi:metal ABC transporter ATP-binding protein [Pseudomonas sp. Marseille-QA0892]